MNANAFRHLFDYHFSENRTIWESNVSTLSPDQFTQPFDYSFGSVRDQIVHLISVDDVWFSALRDIELPEWPDPASFTGQRSVRAYRDKVESSMQSYLAELQDDMLFAKPLDGEDKDLYLWQVLFQVINHGTDHRAQLLRMLNDLGLKTVSQDYVFYAYDNPV